MCKKIKYKDKIASMFALATCKHATKGKRQEIRVYYCSKCHMWHLTKKYDSNFKKRGMDIKS